MKKLLTICIALFITFILFHIIITKRGYSLNSGEVSVYIDIINVFIVTILTIQVFRYNSRKDELDFKTKTPLISIFQEKYFGNYKIKNIGGGPALNIRILSDIDENEKCWRKNIIGFDLFGENVFELDFYNKEQYLILYNDIYGEKYFSYMIDSRLSFGTEKNNIPMDIAKMINYKREDEEFSEHNVPSV